MLLEKDILKICTKFTGEHPSQSAVLIKLQSNFTEITRRHGCSPILNITSTTLNYFVILKLNFRNILKQQYIHRDY